MAHNLPSTYVLSVIGNIEESGESDEHVKALSEAIAWAESQKLPEQEIAIAARPCNKGVSKVAFDYAEANDLKRIGIKVIDSEYWPTNVHVLVSEPTEEMCDRQLANYGDALCVIGEGERVAEVLKERGDGLTLKKLQPADKKAAKKAARRKKRGKK